MLAVIADTSAHTSRMFINGLIEMAASCMVITVTFFTSIRLLAQGRLPRQIVEEVFALLAVQTLRIMRTLAPSVHHVDSVPYSLQRKTSRCVSIARTRSSHDHVRNGVVVLLLNLLAIVQQCIAQRVQTREVDSQIGHLQHVLHVLSVRVLDVHRWQHPVDNLTVFRRFHTRVAMVADHVGNVLADGRHIRERRPAVVGKVPIHVPRFAEVVRPFDQHRGRTERSEHDDQMGKVELRLQVQLDRDVLLAVLRLPPGLLQGARLILVDDLSDPVVLHRDVGRLGPGVAQEAFLLLEMGHDAVALGSHRAAG